MFAFLESIPGKGERGSMPKQPAYEDAFIRGRDGCLRDLASHGIDRSTYKFLVVFGHELDQVLRDEYKYKTGHKAVPTLSAVG